MNKFRYINNIQFRYINNIKKSPHWFSPVDIRNVNSTILNHIKYPLKIEKIFQHILIDYIAYQVGISWIIYKLHTFKKNVMMIFGLQKNIISTTGRT